MFPIVIRTALGTFHINFSALPTSSESVLYDVHANAVLGGGI